MCFLDDMVWYLESCQGNWVTAKDLHHSYVLLTRQILFFLFWLVPTCSLCFCSFIMLHLCERKVRNLRLDLLREKSLPEPLKPAIDQPVWATLCRQVKTSTKGKNGSMQHQELQSVGFASKRLNYLRLTVTGNLPMESIDSHDRAQRLLRPGILWFLCVPCGNTERSPSGKKIWLQALQNSEREPFAFQQNSWTCVQQPAT